MMHTVDLRMRFEGICTAQKNTLDVPQEILRRQLHRFSYQIIGFLLDQTLHQQQPKRRKFRLATK